jgi:hypothetical protein
MESTTKLLTILNGIQSSGSFACEGSIELIAPGLVVKGVGEIAFPLISYQIKSLINIGNRAPYGKGKSTVLDDKVRSSWQIDADKLTFRNREWSKKLDQILNKVKVGLGIEDHQIGAILYKMLIYEKGDFFLPHKDSEKEKNMFGSLIIGLPSVHTGGELIVRFEGKEKKVSFAEATDQYSIPFVSFYSDCEHEIRSVKSGYRVCLVYNLIQYSDSPIKSPRYLKEVADLTELLKKMRYNFDRAPIAIVLGHQYTPTNYTPDGLKLNDRPRSNAIKEAAQHAGYFALMGLVTHYRMGDLMDDSYYSYRRSSRNINPSEQSEMGEIHEEYSEISHWGDPDLPGLGYLHLDPGSVFSLFNIGEGLPTETAEEGFTGNAGMTLEYWYHYGAIIIWPKELHLKLLLKIDLDAQLKWLDYYTKFAKKSSSESKFLEQLFLNIVKGGHRYDEKHLEIDCSPLALALIKLNDAKLFKDHGVKILIDTFHFIRISSWLKLLENYNPDLFERIFSGASIKGDVFNIRHLLSIIVSLASHRKKEMIALANLYSRKIPEYLQKVKIQKSEEVINYWIIEKSKAYDSVVRDIIKYILIINEKLKLDDRWSNLILSRFTTALTRHTVHSVLSPLILEKKYQLNMLKKGLVSKTISCLETATAQQPNPPKNWKRSVPKSKSNSEIWRILSPFLNSKTQQVFDFRRNEYERKKMKYALDDVEIDLKTETIKIGSPYTLRLIKTDASYRRRLKYWKEDIELLKKIKALYPNID